MQSTIRRSSRAWTSFGIVFALLAVPAFLAIFRHRVAVWTPAVLLTRELVVFGFAAILLWIVFFREVLGWSSVGLSKPNWRITSTWILLTLFLVVLAVVVAQLLSAYLNLSRGEVAPGQSYDSVPLYVIFVIVLRAGFVEELTMRGYLYERLYSLSSSRWIAGLVPLLAFSLAHVNQGSAGVLVAFSAGAVLTWAYARLRNLWVTMIVHWICDAVPNLIVPLLSGP